MKRISAPEQTREQLRALIEGRLGTAPERSSLVLLAARLILEEALEGEIRDRIGRERYERADGEAKGYRNGYRPGRMKTAEGMVEFAAPQVRDTAEPFVSEIRETLTGRTQALEDLAVELYARGLGPETSRMRLRKKAGVGSRARGGGRDHRTAVSGVQALSSAICPSTGSSTSTSMELPSGCAPANRVRR